MMQVEQQVWTREGGWLGRGDAGIARADLVLYFAAPGALDGAARFDELRARYPDARLVGCSTGGEIMGDEVLDDAVVSVAMGFERTVVRVARADLGAYEDSVSVGVALARALPHDGLRAVFVLSDGSRVNGSELVRGLRDTLPEAVLLTGGLAGDGANFGTTFVGLDAPPSPGNIVAVGLYGDAIEVGHGSVGGWEAFGPERRITRARGNVLYELDGQPALDLYKRYLGDEAKALPGSALLFPLSIRRGGADLVRTVLSVDEASQTMTFAGDMPEGSTAQLMRASISRLSLAAAEAAERARDGHDWSVAVMVSCIGRKLVMGQRASDEVEAVADVMGPRCVKAGFYSYGEISPAGFARRCELHNQTMTITTLREA